MDGTLIKNSLLFQNETKTLAINIAEMIKNFGDRSGKQKKVEAKGLLNLD